MFEKILHETFRLAIICMTAIALWMDGGYKLSDGVLAISIVVWIFMPEFERVTQLILTKVFDRDNEASSIAKR